MFAKRLERIRLSPTLQIMSQAQKMREEGQDVVILAAGELDFEAPDYLKHAALQAMEQGLNRYTSVDGLPAFKKAIIQKFKRENKLDFTLDEIIVSAGAKQVLFNALFATIEEGDEVIILAPYWPSYFDMVTLFNGVPVVIQTKEEHDFKVTPEQLRHAITDKTKWLMINSPSNPSGSVYSKEDFEKLAVVLREFPHVHVMADDIYEHVTYGASFVSLLNVAPDLKERTLTVNGLSKAFAITGWRVGYGAGSKALIKAMTKLQSQSTTNANSVAQGAGAIALNQGHAFPKEWEESLRARRDFIVEAINSIKGLHTNSPSGSFYIYVNCEGLIGKVTPKGRTLQNDHEICAYFLDYGVALVPGSAFGLSPYFRISFASSMEDLEKAAHRMKKAVLEVI